MKATSSWRDNSPEELCDCQCYVHSYRISFLEHMHMVQLDG